MSYTSFKQTSNSISNSNQFVINPFYVQSYYPCYNTFNQIQVIQYQHPHSHYSLMQSNQLNGYFPAIYYHSSFYVNHQFYNYQSPLFYLPCSIISPKQNYYMNTELEEQIEENTSNKTNPIFVNHSPLKNENEKTELIQTLPKDSPVELFNIDQPSDLSSFKIDFLTKSKLSENNPQEDHRSDLVYFKKICATSLKIFKNPCLLTNEDFELNFYERIVLLEILQRKFRISRAVCREYRDLSSNALLKLTTKKIITKSKKRIEERKKFIFKRTIKYLKLQFEKKVQMQQNLGFWSEEMTFYSYYFKDLLSKTNISVTHLQDPFNCKANDKIHRTLSRIYLGFIFKSELFKNDFISYFESEDFINDYMNSIEQKISLMIKRAEVIFTKSDSQEDFENTIKNYFQQNNQCKFPWVIQEINHAVVSFINFIKKLEKKALEK